MWSSSFVLDLRPIHPADLKRWEESVRNVAVGLTKGAFARFRQLRAPLLIAYTPTAFLNGEILPPPSSLSSVAASQLPCTPRDTSDPLSRNAMEACAICTTDPAAPVLVRRDQKARHEASKPHRWAVRRAKGPRGADLGEEAERKRAERLALRAGKAERENEE